MKEIPCVGAVVHDADGRLLVVLRGQPPGAGLWSVPGGRVESGETLEQACAREVLEETGISVTVGRLLGSVRRDSPTGDTYVIHDFHSSLAPDAPASLRAGDDADDCRWVSLRELLDLPVVDGLIEALQSWNSLPR